MPLYDRDYMQARGGSAWGGRGGAWSVTQILIGLNIAVFLLQQFLPESDFLLALWPGAVLSGRVWQLLTYNFCHGGLMHLLFNMLFLWWFGRELESMYGGGRFLRFYLVSGIGAGLAFVAGAVFHGDPRPAVGASGCVMGLLVLYAFHYPRRQVLFYGIIPMEIRWLVGLYVLMDLSGYMGGSSGIANAAHLGGAEYGAAYALWERRR